jgi:hypothetical protein
MGALLGAPAGPATAMAAGRVPWHFYRIADGDTLSRYADQWPCTTALWSQPVFTGYAAGDGSVISAGNYQATYSEYPWKAMDG